MKITTKTGDGGETGLFGGKRVRKSSAYMSALGDLDELNSVLGWAGVAAREASRSEKNPPRGGESARAEVSQENFELFERLQDDVYKIMSFIGSEFKWHMHIEPISEADVELLEDEIAKYEEAVGGLNKFIKPGGNEKAARLHIARSVCRRAERSYVAVMEEQSSGDSAKTGEHEKMAGGFTSADSLAVLKYLNRLSDLLFVMAYSEG